MKTRISILGATGSIGQSTLNVIAAHPERFDIIALTANDDVEGLVNLCRQFHPTYAALANVEKQATLAQALAGSNTKIINGVSAIDTIAAMPVDMCVAAIVGMAGLLPIMCAIQAGSRIALANKESLVCAGEHLLAAARAHGADILPIDSEHNAVFQLLKNESSRDVEAITLTASGGPFLQRALESFAYITPKEACAHPNWNMGSKISVDSATMMNKALEVIEAHYLFGLPYSKLKTVIHPESIVHALVHYHDGSVTAQLAMPDMQIPISYVLGLGERLPLSINKLDITALGTLSFLPLDDARYPLFGLCLQAAQQNTCSMIYANAANEIAVAAFLEGRIAFTQIVNLVDQVLQQHISMAITSIADVIACDQAARRLAQQLLKEPRHGMAS